MISVKRLFAVSFLVTGLAWLVFAWPLPRYTFQGIPSSAHNLERESARRMIGGDHLQFHYFYWLFSDMLAGGTPLFENRYEFNTGDDAERRNPGSYNMPLSLAYAALRPVGGRAFAWNMTLFLSLWLTHAFTWLLLRRWTGSHRLAALIAVAAFAFPFRWVMLFGGSPTGTAMAWIALLALGTAMAVDDDRPSGGWLAALALLLAWLNDRHVFFFSFLALPGLILLFLLLRRPRPQPAPWKQRLLALLPLVAAALVLGAVAARSAVSGFAHTSLETGRAIEEVRKFSPFARGLVAWGGRGRDAHIYLGWLFFALAALHLVLIVKTWPARSFQERRRGVAGLLLGLAGGLTILLALGPKGPWDGALFDFVRAHVPGSKVLRQPAKIFCLFTFLLPAALALAVADLQAAAGRRPRLRALAALLPLLLVGDYALQISPTVCLLDNQQAAYAAVAADAAAKARIPRAVVIPLWPGDSDWAAVYQHYVSLYRIRMLNGYRPVVPRSYQEWISRFYSLNVGQVDDAQLAILRERGFHYLILHEDAFPEKASPFPVAYTLDRLLAHPRLALLKQAENIWAFELLDSPRPDAPDAPSHGALFPTRSWELERMPRTAATEVDDDTACSGRYLQLTEAGAAIAMRPFRADTVPDPVLMLRLRGAGTLAFAADSNRPPDRAIAVASPDWRWFPLPLDPARADPVAPRLTLDQGTVDADYAVLTAGLWTPPAPGESVVFPASRFFHAGWSDPVAGTVHLRPEYDPSDYLFYGPRLPFPAGTIEIAMDLETPAPAGTKLGRLIVDSLGFAKGPYPVTAGEPVRLRFEQESDRPLTLLFQYRRHAPITIKSVRFTPLRAAAPGSDDAGRHAEGD